MGSRSIDPVKPARQVGIACIGCVLGQAVGPFAQRGLDEAFGLCGKAPGRDARSPISPIRARFRDAAVMAVQPIVARIVAGNVK